MANPARDLRYGRRAGAWAEGWSDEDEARYQAAKTETNVEDDTEGFGALPGEWADHPDRPCVDPALGSARQRHRMFFPDRGEATGPAKAACGRCPVKDDCLEFALENREKFGIWGGASERERRRMRRRRAS